MAVFFDWMVDNNTGTTSNWGNAPEKPKKEPVTRKVHDRQNLAMVRERQMKREWRKR